MALIAFIPEKAAIFAINSSPLHRVKLTFCDDTIIGWQHCDEGADPLMRVTLDKNGAVAKLDRFGIVKEEWDGEALDKPQFFGANGSWGATLYESGVSIEKLLQESGHMTAYVSKDIFSVVSVKLNTPCRATGRSYTAKEL